LIGESHPSEFTSTYFNHSPEPPTESEDPVPPPRRFKKEGLYESLPESLKTELQVRTKIETDEKLVKERQELCRYFVVLF
jgi:hypothetical protein